MKKMRKVLALTLSATMALGMSMTGMAADSEVSVDAPIYAYDITNVIVPATYVVAFNPNELDVTKGGSTVNDQIVSKNYGIINKSSKDKVITVSFEVEDLNEGQITFTDQAADVTNAAADDYVINLTMVPADTSEVKVGSTPDSADQDTAAAELGDVTMTGATGSAQNLVAGTNEIDFLLEKAVYTGSIDLDNKTDNNVADAFTLTGLAAAGKGITAFTFGGTMNGKADWTKLTKGIRITAVYDNENAPDGASTAVDSNTGALYVNPNPFKTGDEVGTIKYRKGSGTDALASITKIEMDYAGTIYDGYNAMGSTWPAATDENKMITLPTKFMANFIAKYPDDDVREATVYYTTSDGTEKTAKVDVRLKKPVVVGATFTAGSEVGTINYVVGAGNDALASITKIEMDYNGTIFDGYNANGSTWPAATDVDGKITLPTKYVTNFVTQYPSDTTREATITYVTSGGETKTAKVDVKLK